MAVNAGQVLHPIRKYPKQRMLYNKHRSCEERERCKKNRKNNENVIYSKRQRWRFFDT